MTRLQYGLVAGVAASIISLLLVAAIPLAVSDDSPIRGVSNQKLLTGSLATIVASGPVWLLSFGPWSRLESRWTRGEMIVRLAVVLSVLSLLLSFAANALIEPSI
jgi:hypothetical protein